MKRQINLCLIAFAILWSHSLLAQGIKFEKGTWAEVLAKAKKENKPIFVDAYTTWCGPCKWMSKNTFPQEEVGKYMNAHFVSVKMDMEKGEGIDFREKNQVNVFPTLLYFSSEGELMHKGVGGQNAEQLLALSADAIDPSKQLVGLKKKYAAGNTDKAFLAKYIGILMAAYEPAEEPLNKYFGLLSDEEKLTEENLDLFGQATESFSDFRKPLAKFFLDNRTNYKKNVAAEKVDEYAAMSFSRSLWNISKVENKKEQNNLAKELGTYFPEKKKEIKPTIAYNQAIKTEDPKKINKALDKYMKVCSNWQMINGTAWQVFEKEDDPKMVKKALKWIDRSIGMTRNYFNVDTKAALLYKAGKYAEAKTTAEEAIKLAEAEGSDPSGSKELLEQIKLKLN